MLGVGLTDIHSEISEYAQELIDIPRAHLSLELSQDDSGLKLVHQDKMLARCYLTREGMAAGAYMAKALGSSVPSEGVIIKIRVSTGVLFRAISIASLDFGLDESFVLLDRLLNEAEMQRGGSSDAV